MKVKGYVTRVSGMVGMEAKYKLALKKAEPIKTPLLCLMVKV